MKNYDSTEATEIYENIPSCICSSRVVTVTDSFLCQPKREGKGKGGKGKKKKKKEGKMFPRAKSYITRLFWGIILDKKHVLKEEFLSSE